MLNKNLIVEVLTPNRNQIDFIKSKFKDITNHNCKFENLESGNKYGTVINSESLQYIKLDDAFKKMDTIILPHGKWIVVDYFRLNDRGINKSAHILDSFKSKLEEYGWKISYEKDITANVLPTIAFANLFYNRILIPIKHYAYEKLRYKKAWLYYLTEKLRVSIDKKIVKENASIDPEQFVNEKKYMFFVLEKIKN